MAWKRKKSKDTQVNRIIPSADLTNLTVPNFNPQRKLSEKDINILRKVSQEFTDTGVLDKDIIEPAYSIVDEQDSVMFTAGAAGENNVKKLKSQSLDVQKLLASREYDEGDVFDNPSLDGIDDYGDQVYDVYDDSLPSIGSILDHHISNEKEDPADFDPHVNIRLPDGTFVIGEIPGYRE